MPKRLLRTSVGQVVLELDVGRIREDSVAEGWVVVEAPFGADLWSAYRSRAEREESYVAWAEDTEAGIARVLCKVGVPDHEARQCAAVVMPEWIELRRPIEADVRQRYAECEETRLSPMHSRLSDALWYSGTVGGFLLAMFGAVVLIWLLVKAA